MAGEVPSGDTVEVVVTAAVEVLVVTVIAIRMELVHGLVEVEMM